jgi:hypothetical protein
MVFPGTPAYRSASHPEGMTEDTPPERLPGQLRPDEKGRCHFKGRAVLVTRGWCSSAPPAQLRLYAQAGAEPDWEDTTSTA